MIETKPRFKAGVRGLLRKWWRVLAELRIWGDHDVGISEICSPNILTEIQCIVRVRIGIRVEKCRRKVIPNRKRLGRTGSSRPHLLTSPVLSSCPLLGALSMTFYRRLILFRFQDSASVTRASRHPAVTQLSEARGSDLLVGVPNTLDFFEGWNGGLMACMDCKVVNTIQLRKKGI